MTSVSTEKTESTEPSPLGGWIFYDRDCRSCSDLARRFSEIFRRRGFAFVPLQEPWVQRELGLSAAKLLSEMRVLTSDRNALAGADAVIFLAQQVWWMSPLSWAATLPGAHQLLHRLYRWVAAHRTCAIPREPQTPRLLRTRWLPLLLAPLVAAKSFLPPSGAIFLLYP